MLKRNGELCEHSVPGFDGRLTRGEMDAYNEAFDAIKSEFEALERVRDGVKDMAQEPVVFTIPQHRQSDDIIEIRNVPVDRWQVDSTLLKLRSSEVLLCERSIQGEKEFAVIERFPRDSAYAKANGDADVLLIGNDPVLLVQDYATNAQHTLRYMASNLVAKAHKIVWERFASTDPVRVIRAISERCADAASLDQSETQQRVELQGRFQRHAAGHRV